MATVLKVLAGLFLLLFGVMGLQIVFVPASALEQFAVQPQGVVGLNTLRGDLGGMFLGVATLLGLGLRRGEGRWLLAVAVLMGFIAFGRFVGMVVDGPQLETVLPFLIEVVLASTCVGLHRLQG